MADEVASAVLSAGTKSIETALELIRMLAPAAKNVLSKTAKKVGKGIESISNKGAVSNTMLVSEARKSQSTILSQSNFLARDAERIAEKASEYKIPISIIGTGEKQTVEFLDRDKAVMNQITLEVMQERMKGNPESVKCFNVSEYNVSAMKALFEENGIECQFLQAADGKIKCVYPAENAEQVAVLKEDYQKLHSEIAENFSVQRDENGISVTDAALGKSVPIKPQNKEQVSAVLQENFGYSKAKADLAANKICQELQLDKEKFMSKSQIDNINSLKTNIRYQSDDLTLRETRFDAINFKDGNTTHIFIQNGDKTATLTPEKMTKSEMKEICTNQLGMSEQQAEKAVAKATKIDAQVKSQIAERTVDKSGISHEAHIEKTSSETFSVQLGDKTKYYNFSTINLEDKIAKDFGIPKENAKNIVAKANRQSLLQNNIRKASKSKTSEISAPKLKESKGLKR